MKRILSALGLVLLLASLYFFYGTVAFLAEPDYVAAAIELVAGATAAKAGLSLLERFARSGGQS